MGTRLIAAFVLVAALGAVAWTALGSDDEGSVAETASAAAVDASGNDTAEGDTSSDSASSSEPTTTTTEEPFPEPENFGPRLGLVDLDGWINTDITSLDELDGQVVVVEMWTFGCFNCKNRIPHTQELYADYKDQGLEIVGVHAPEFSYEAEIPAIEEAVDRLGVTWPVAIDTEKRNFRAWQEGGRRFWPRTYVVDQNGDIRYDHIGEGRYDELEQTVAWLLDNPPVATS